MDFKLHDSAGAIPRTVTWLAYHTDILHLRCITIEFIQLFLPILFSQIIE